MHKILQLIQQKKNRNFFLIAGPCVYESEEMSMLIAEKVNEITRRLKIPYIFKASYKKANRSSLNSFTGVGDEKALIGINKIGLKFDVPVLTDVHSHDEVLLAAPYADVLQIPAFLCRQTDLLLAAGNTGKVINIKKGQFLSPEGMKFAVQKVNSTGNIDVWLTERGSTFGYNDLVVDFRSIPVMQSLDAIVVLDVTHSLQQPNQISGVTGGRPEFIETIAKAGIAARVDGIFIETHPDPSMAKSDGANMLALDKLEGLLEKLVKIRSAVI